MWRLFLWLEEFIGKECAGALLTLMGIGSLAVWLWDRYRKAEEERLRQRYGFWLGRRVETWRGKGTVQRVIENDDGSITLVVWYGNGPPKWLTPKDPCPSPHWGVTRPEDCKLVEDEEGEEGRMI